MKEYAVNKNVIVKRELFMSEDLFKEAFLEAREEAAAEYKQEISEMGMALEKFFNNVLETISFNEKELMKH